MGIEEKKGHVEYFQIFEKSKSKIYNKFLYYLRVLNWLIGNLR